MLEMCVIVIPGYVYVGCFRGSKVDNSMLYPLLLCTTKTPFVTKGNP